MSRENGVVDFETDFLPYFRDVYREFPVEKYPDWLVRRYFEQAAYGKIIKNANDSRVPFSDTDPQRLILYAKVVAHGCFLSARGAGMTGQITAGTQGSVSASLQPVTLGTNYSDWAQSEYGIEFWRMTLPLRSMVYVTPLWPSWK